MSVSRRPKRVRSAKRSGGMSGGFLSLFSPLSRKPRSAGLARKLVYSNRAMMAVVGLVVASGIAVITYSMAAVAAFNWSATVSSNVRTASYKVVATNTGNITAKLKWSRAAQLQLQLTAPDGMVVYNKTGASPLSVNTGATKGTYTFQVTWVSGSKNVPFTLTGNVTTPDPTPTPSLSPTATPIASAIPTPSPTPSPIGGCPSSTPNAPGGADPWGGCWPGPGNTGVPAGTVLTTYTGPCIITVDNTVIDSKTINCPALEIQAKAVVVKNSKLNGQLYINSDAAVTQYNLTYSAILQDSEVNAPLIQEPAVFEGAITVIRSNIHGGITSIQCGDKAAQCIIQDSWLHGQLMPQGVDWHLGGFHSIGGTNYTLTHNYVICDTPVNDVGGGCSGDIVFIPYDKSISHANVFNNFNGASTSLAYCMYTGDKAGYPSSYMVFKDNVFARGTNGRCGDYGPVDQFVAGTGNQWVGNIWDDGSVVTP